MRRAVAAAALLTALAWTTGASAGVYADDLSKCLVNKATEEDRLNLAKWMFAAISANPQLKSMSTVTPEQRAAFNAKLAQLVERLLLDDCHKETVDALKNEGEGALSESFNVLGQTAGRELFNDPETRAQLGSMQSAVHKERWEAIRKEAGLPAD